MCVATIFVMTTAYVNAVSGLLLKLAPNVAEALSSACCCPLLPRCPVAQAIRLPRGRGLGLSSAFRRCTARDSAMTSPSYCSVYSRGVGAVYVFP